MKAKPLTQHYPYLTPEDRFRLILAASGRGDEVERDRLIRAGKHITVSRQDHAPYACAFQEVSRLTFLQVIEEVARYFDVLAGVAVAFDEYEGDAAQHSAAASEAADAARPLLG